MSTLVAWIRPYEEYIEFDWLATNPNPKLIPYLKENPGNISWDYLSQNANALNMLKENTSRIDWEKICLNQHPEAMRLINEHYDYYAKKWDEKHRRTPYDMVLSWKNLSQNPMAVRFLYKTPKNLYWNCVEGPYSPQQDDCDYVDEFLENRYPDYEINWANLSANPKASLLLEMEPENIKWDYLSSNPSAEAIELLLENPENIDWYWLSANPYAIEILKKNLNQIYWNQLSKNPCPGAVKLLKENPENIDWTYLSANPHAIELLEENPENIDWRWLCRNPGAKELLAENIKNEFDKLDWQWLSENPCIFDKKT